MILKEIQDVYEYATKYFNSINTLYNSVYYYLYLGKFNGPSGDISTNEHTFNTYIHKINNYLKKEFVIQHYKLYQYFDKELLIINDKKIYKNSHILSSLMTCNFCINIINETIITSDDFPLVNNMTSIIDISDKIYKLKNIDDVELILSKRTFTNNESIFVIYIRYLPKYAYNVKILLENIFKNN